MMVFLKKFYLFFLFLLLIIFLNGCTNKLTNFFSEKDLVDGDKGSDLLFWNFQGLKCFFEKYSFQDSGVERIDAGNSTDIPFCGDFVGDKVFSYGTFRNVGNNNLWSFTDGLTRLTVGEVGDIPAPGDYDGDGKYDYIVYRPRNSGFYGPLSKDDKQLEIHLGITGDIPAPKDYDGDGLSDLATYRVTGGTWTIKSSKNALSKQVILGGLNYFPIPGDYDGDGRADLAVWNHKNNKCKIIFSFFNQKLSDKLNLQIQEKLKGVICFPASSDYDGDNKCELAFWDYKNNLLHVFNIKNNNVQYKEHKVNISENAKPVNYFLLSRYLRKDFKIDTSDLYKKFASSFSSGKNEIKADIDGDLKNDPVIYNYSSNSFLVKNSSDNQSKTVPFSGFKGEPLAGDFDGDGKDDVGLVDFNEKTFAYYSLGLSMFSNLVLDKRVNGSPFACDVDLDFMSDLAFYSPKTMIFGFVKSSEDYRYDEVLYERYGKEK